MLNTIRGFLLLSFVLSSQLFARGPILTPDSEKVVYGEDNRQDVFEATSTLYKTLASSTAAMISNSQLETQSDGSVLIGGITLEEQTGVCPDARFAKQLTAADCSGFLVGDQYLVTAGHCIESMSDCRSRSWVFGYANTTEEKATHVAQKSDVYTCTEIISRALDRATRDDFALLKLDRKVEGRTPLKFRKTDKIADRASLVVIGHPTGLPTKIADGAYVRTNSIKQYFITNLDTFGGNSGSAVFDATTGIVEGILVRGETDYERDPVQNCMRPNVCEMNGCRGEDVTRITNIKALQTLEL